MSGHCRRRMQERGITEHDVYLAVENPDEVVDTDEPSKCFMRTFTNGKTLKVWVVTPMVGDKRIVKSTAWKGRET